MTVGGALLNFRDVLKEANSRVNEATEHAIIPFVKVVELLSPERDASRTPIFQTMLTWEESKNSTDSSKFEIEIQLGESQNGVIDGSGQPGETTCDLGSGSVVYTARLSFDGTIASDSSAVGMFFEDNISFFEGDWTGFATLTDPIQVSGTFNQNVDTVNPGGLVSVSGSFFAEQ